VHLEVRLEALGKPFVARGFDVRHVAIWSKHLDEALEQVFDDNLPDLVIQPSRHHLFAASMIRQPNEWRMIRLPKVPVLLQQQTGSLSGRVLLALDVGEVEVSQEMNQCIIRQVKKWCTATQSELHILNAFPSAADLMAFAPAEWTIPQIQSTLEDQHKERLRALAKETGVDPTCIHVGEGPVAQVISEFAERLGVSLVVLTSHCRRGVSGFFVGNTAEIVLEQTKLNLLVLKPAY
jgi:universal stress protein E